MHPSGPHLIVEPDDGLEPVRQFIESAQTCLLVKQFTFTVVGRLKAVFDGDRDLSHRYAPPDPLDPSEHHEDDFPHDAELRHE